PKRGSRARVSHVGAAPAPLLRVGVEQERRAVAAGVPRPKARFGGPSAGRSGRWCPAAEPRARTRVRIKAPTGARTGAGTGALFARPRRSESAAPAGFGARR